jgi:hypothetical protein
MELLSVAEVLCIGRRTGGRRWLDEKREKMKEIWWHTEVRSKRKIDEVCLSDRMIGLVENCGCG